MKMGRIFLLILGTMGALSVAWAGRVIDLRSGEELSSEELLSQGKVLIFVEKGCEACRALRKELEDCKEPLPSQFYWISTDSHRTARVEFRRFGKTPFVVRSPREFPELRGTPTVMVGAQRHLGLASCEDVQRMRKEK